ncbi:hypothetical protein SLEP1_g50886 [Rubroshorea leprosula]|uniref:Uncharacterized protein n=1 Tax=Rubroshorea leprosula TaxID=152421 RepID=A0AAV5M1P5_9ROSI|nr:hypothetical protein SLEP1_g50886 [Rubroshorea leprosula]
MLSTQGCMVLIFQLTEKLLVLAESNERAVEASIGGGGGGGGGGKTCLSLTGGKVDILGGLLHRSKVPRQMLQSAWSILTMGCELK